MICSWYKRYSWLIVIVCDLYSWWTIFSYNLKDLSFIYRKFQINKKLTLKILYANYIRYNFTWFLLFLVVFSWWLKAYDLVYLYFIQIYLCCSEKLKSYECIWTSFNFHIFSQVSRCLCFFLSFLSLKYDSKWI